MSEKAFENKGRRPQETVVLQWLSGSKGSPNDFHFSTDSAVTGCYGHDVATTSAKPRKAALGQEFTGMRTPPIAIGENRGMTDRKVMSSKTGSWNTGEDGLFRPLSPTLQ
jgi:hypothetical protein